MFNETGKYKNNGHFFFETGDVLSLVSENVSEGSGVYYILKLAHGRVDLVSIGKSDNLKQKFCSDVEGMINKQLFEQKIVEESIDTLDIYWFVTIDNKHNDLPKYVEGLLMQRYFELYGHIPPWNK